MKSMTKIGQVCFWMVVFQMFMGWPCLADDAMPITVQGNVLNDFYSPNGNYTIIIDSEEYHWIAIQVQHGQVVNFKNDIITTETIYTWIHTPDYKHNVFVQTIYTKATRITVTLDKIQLDRNVRVFNIPANLIKIDKI